MSSQVPPFVQGSTPPTPPMPIYGSGIGSNSHHFNAEVETALPQRGEIASEVSSLSEESPSVLDQSFRVSTAARGHFFGYEGGRNNESMPHGEGVRTDLDGTVYRGSWRNGKIVNGEIVYTFGQEYRGKVRETDQGEVLFNGEGTLTFSEGHKWVGMWKDDVFQEGFVEILGGGYYKGTWFSSESGNGPHGTGVMVTNDQTLDGQWQEGRFISGKVFYGNGKRYIGEWIQNGSVSGPHGNGEMTYPNGDFELGTWDSGAFLNGRKKFTDSEGRVHHGWYSMEQCALARNEDNEESLGAISVVSEVSSYNVGENSSGHLNGVFVKPQALRLEPIVVKG